MELAKVTSKGQITIPIEIRRKLGIKEGDKILFLEKDGEIQIINSTILAFKSAQEAFQGEAKKAGLQSEEDIVRMVKEMRE